MKKDDRKQDEKTQKEKRITLIFDTNNEKQMDMYKNLENLAKEEIRSLPNYIISELSKVIDNSQKGISE